MRKSRRRYGICFLILCALQASGGPFSAFADTVYVDASSLNYRESPSMEGRILGTLPGGSSLSRQENLGEWSVVTVGGVRCYVASRYLSASAPASVPASALDSVSASASALDSASASASVLDSASASAYAARAWKVSLDPDYTYASYSKINSGQAVYYETNRPDRKGKTVCVNAGHGTKGGSSVQTLCHPDGSPKVTGGTTAAGATTAVAVSSGMTFADGTAESQVTLSMAKILREKLLAAGYNVLMIREESDVQLDNIARTVIANHNADCHIALHWDSTSKDKGAFFMSVPSSQTYRAMEPVASHWQEHNRLGSCLVEGLREAGVKIFSSGSMEMDLTQTSYSTIPSVDIELGDKASDHSQAALSRLAEGLLAGIDAYFESPGIEKV